MARSAYSFKTVLEDFWSNQYVVYDWRVNLTEIGSRSECNINLCVYNVLCFCKEAYYSLRP